MRTKTLLLTAALAAAGAATAMAQSTIYSVNAVGYVNSTIRGLTGSASAAQGFGAYANPFEADVTLGTLIPDGSPPASLTFLNFNDDGSSNSASYDKANDDFWTDGSIPLKLGKGFLIKNFGADFNVTWVGQVKQSVGSTPISNPIAQGQFLYGSFIPQEATLSALGLDAPNRAVTVLRFLSNSELGGGTQQVGYNPDDGFWDPIDPVIHIGEGFFITSSSGPVTWQKEFHVN